jgi:hypothetical protein
MPVSVVVCRLEPMAAGLSLIYLSCEQENYAKDASENSRGVVEVFASCCLGRGEHAKRDT